MDGRGRARPRAAPSRPHRLGKAAFAPVEGVRLTLRLDDGTHQELRGLVVGEDEEHLHVLRCGQTIRVRQARIVARVAEALDPRAIWTPAQLVRRYLERLADRLGVTEQALTTAQRFRLAEYARAVGDFQAARAHYVRCAQDPGFERAKIVRQRIEEIDALLRDEAALEALRRMRAALWLREYRRVREALEQFPGEHPGVGEPVRRRLQEVRKDFQARRAEHVQREAGIRFPKVLAALIAAKVRETGISITDALAWARCDLTDAAFRVVAAGLARFDDVTPEEARALWESRPRGAWRTASFGSGTFIVRPSPGGERGAPRPPTRDRWWTSAPARERASWILAFFVQDSGVFEVEAPKTRPCATCGARGVVRGAACPRCHGARGEITARYR